MLLFQSDAEVSVLPPMVPGLPPPFHQISPLSFQGLCRDLFAVQQGITRCDVYGVNGQKQFGIDLLAYREGQKGIEVGQCKCYGKFDETDLIAATKEFLDHREHWSGRNVRKFILFIACSLDRRQVQDEIPRQERIFAAERIGYEVWSATTISARLREHSDIVWHYTHSDYWVRAIYGTTDATQAGIQSGSQAPQIIDAALVAQNTSLSERLSSEVLQGLEEMREAWREGRGASARVWVDKQISDSVTWAILPDPTKAAILRLNAVLALGIDEDIPRAQRLIGDAVQLHTPTPRPVIDTIVIFRADGADAALLMLNEADDIEQLNLRVHPS